MQHELKIWVEHFHAIDRGTKTFEVRSNAGRNFHVGDELLLNEYGPESKTYTGRQLRAVVTLVHSGLGLQDGYVILALASVTRSGHAWDYLDNELKLLDDLVKSSNEAFEQRRRAEKAEARVRELEQPQAPVESVEVTAPPMDRFMQERIGAEMIAGRLRVACGVSRADGVLDLHLVPAESEKSDDDGADELAGIPTDMAVDVGHAGPVAGFADPAKGVGFMFANGAPGPTIQLHPGAKAAIHFGGSSADLSSIVRDIQSNAERAGEAAP